MSLELIDRWVDLQRGENGWEDGKETLSRQVGKVME